MAPISKSKAPFKKRPPIAGDSNKAIAHYFQSKIDEQTAVKFYAEWDVIKGEPIIDLMRLYREMKTADEDLLQKRKEYKSGRELADKQWKDLRDKQNLLRRSFLTFEDFVRENREKRDRGYRKIKDEQERQNIRIAEISELKNSLEYMEKVRDKMLGYVKAYQPFQKYLESMLETHEFQSIAEIFNRFETLIAARSALLENQDNNLKKLEDTSAQLHKMTEEKSQILIDLNSRLAQLQSRHERARAKALHWEMVVARIKDVTSRKELHETQVHSCIWNLYQEICRRKELPVEAKKEELEQQLVHVKRTIQGLGKIVKAAKHKAEREERDKRNVAVAAKIEQAKPDTTSVGLESRTSYRSSLHSAQSTISYKRT